MPIQTSKTASTVGDPYITQNEEIAQQEKTKQKARIALILADEKQYADDYENEDKKLKARVGEIAITSEGFLGVMVENEDGRITFVSRSKEDHEILEQLEELGVLQSARAYASNAALNYILFDNERRIVNPNPDKLYRNSYCYYAIRSNEKNLEGEYEWITGIIGDDGYGVQKLLTPLIDMEKVERIVNEQVVVQSQTKTGSIIRDMVDGESYTIIFYDADRRPIAMESYDARSVTSQSGLLAPNTAITGLRVISSRIGPEDNSTYLYAGESAANIALRIFVKYADGTEREVTQESVSNGRLIIEGLDQISTEYPSDETHLPYSLTIKYYFLDSNADQSSGVQSDGSNIDTRSNSISASYKVYIKEDIYDSITKITPVGYINGESNLPTTKMQLKLFALYQSGTSRDITPLTKAQDRLIGYDNAVYNNSKDTWDALNTEINTGIKTVIAKLPQGISQTTKSFSFTLETSTAHRRFIINSLNSKFVLFNAYTGKMNFEENVSSPILANENKFTYDDGTEIIPTHFSIRNALEPAALYADKIALDNIRGFSFNTATGLQPFTDMPLLIEFSKITDASDGVTTSVFITNTALYYAKQNN